MYLWRLIGEVTMILQTLEMQCLLQVLNLC